MATGSLPNGFRAEEIVRGVRYQDLDRRQQYFDCTQHDMKKYDFDGRTVRTGPATQQPLLTSEAAPYFVPLRQRRPSHPVRIGKAIVNAFTNLLFSDGRWPHILCQGDQDTQDFAEALAEEEELEVRMIEARSLGGSVGSVGLSWCFDKGKPRVEIHNTKNLYVAEWEDRRQLIPGYVCEVYLFPRSEWNAERQRFETRLYYQRHDWTPDREVGYEPALYRMNEEPVWIEDPEQTVDHNFGFVPFVWVQNLPHVEPEGLPDYHGEYESMDSLDIIASILLRGTSLNLDPTLILKMNPTILGKAGIRKGSDMSLAVGEGGDAKYLELTGTSVEAGIKVFELSRASILESTECVIPDPDEVAAAGTSSVAIKAIYQRMLGKSGIHRKQYGKAILQLKEQQLKVARATMGTSITITSPGVEGGEETSEEAVNHIDLPKKVEKKPKTDENGVETGEFDVEEKDRDPGKGERLKLSWGEWFPLTPTDRSQAITAASTASGGKPIVSQQTAVEVAAAVFDRDPNQEWARLSTQQQADEKKEADKQADMFQNAGIGGPAGGGGGNPFAKKGGTPKPSGGTALKPAKGPPGPNRAGGNMLAGPPTQKAPPK